MATVHINNRPVDIGDEKLNLIQAALKIGAFIPYYCWHPALAVVASCRMCLVEIGERWHLAGNGGGSISRGETPLKGEPRRPQ